MKRAAKRKPAGYPAKWLPWEPEFIELFRIVDDTWTPPAKIRTQAGRAHTTITGRFTDASGHVFTASSRLEREGDKIVVVESGLSASFKMQGVAS